MEKRKGDPLSCSSTKRQAREVPPSFSGMGIKQEPDQATLLTDEEYTEIQTHYYQESKTFFNESKTTFALQDLADSADSKSVTLVSLTTASTMDSTQFHSTEDSVSGSATDHDNSDPSSAYSSDILDKEEQEQEDCDIRSEYGLIMAGPTNPLIVERKAEGTTKPFKFDEEYLHLKCDWEDCDFETRFINEFISHVSQHTPLFAVVYGQKKPPKVCKWENCPFKSLVKEDMERHVYFHAYHTKIKCLGHNAITRSGTTMCRQDGYTRNVIPALSTLVCAWDNCSETFINIQMYYDHIHHHCQDQPAGKRVSGGIRCLWSGCVNIYHNKTKLQDHMKSHTQEKTLACPTCGGLFSNRTRLLDHCLRQEAEQHYGCEVCSKTFSSPRLLRDHIRSHVNILRCKHCDMTCPSPSALVSHVAYRHSDQKPFPCTICSSYAAKSQSDLTRHIKGHTQPLLTCEAEDCDYRVKSQAAMNSHFDKMHSSSKTPRYRCHLCDKLYHRGNILTKHLINVHKLVWPAGHSRFRYKVGEDNLYTLLTLRYESEDVRPSAAQIAASLEAADDGDSNDNDDEVAQG